MSVNAFALTSRSTSTTFGLRARRHHVRRRPGIRANARANDESTVEAPRALEDALAGAARACARARRARKSAKSKPFRACIELPLADSSDSSALALAQSVVGKNASEATCVFGTRSARDEALRRRSEYEAIDVNEEWGIEKARARKGVIVFVGVSEKDVSAAAKKCEEGGERECAAANVEWAHDGDGGKSFSAKVKKANATEAFANSFTVVYSFLPLKIDIAWGSSLEGAVFKRVEDGNVEDEPWRVLVKEGGKFEQVGAMQRRPQQGDIEAALYNSIAAKSPVNKGVGFLSEAARGLFGRDRK